MSGVPPAGPVPGFRSGFAALAGRANVGKSTLLNRLVGEKLAIVSPVPQTTRDRVLGVRTLPTGQVAFVDSPGFHKPQDQLGEIMLERAKEAAGGADVVLLVTDATAGFGPGDRFALEMIKAQGAGRPLVVVLNKVDQINKAKALPLIEEAVGEWGCAEAVPVSALTGDNCDRLLQVVVGLLPEGPLLFPENFVTDRDEKRFAAEVIREKLLERLRREVPHSVAVLIEHSALRPDGILDLSAVILVERPGQKGIVIGHQGRLLKEVGTLARREIEKRAGRQVFLQLWVKVRPDWRDRLSILRDIGVLPH